MPKEKTRQDQAFHQPQRVAKGSLNCFAPTPTVGAAFFTGNPGRDVELLQGSLADHQLQMAPVVLSELLSDPHLPRDDEQALSTIPLLEITSGYWYRARRLRAKLIGLGHRPKLADTLIAQSCLDHGVTLITRDRDFAPFAKYCKLMLLV